MSRAPRSRTRAAGLVWRHLVSGGATPLLLALLLTIAVFVVAAVPRALTALADAELRAELADTSPLRADLTGGGSFGVLLTRGVDRTGDALFGELDDYIERVAADMEPPLGPALASPDWTVQLADEDASPQDPENRARASVSLVIDLEWRDRVQLIEGEAPAVWTGTTDGDDDPATRPPIEIAMPRDLAERMGLRVGDQLDYRLAPLRVSAIYDAVDPGDVNWVRYPELRQARLPASSLEGAALIGSVYVDPGSAGGLARELQNAQLRVWWGVDGDRLRFDDIPEVLAQLRQLGALGQPVGTAQYLEFQSGLDFAMGRVTDRVGTVTALLALLGSAPLGAVLALLALGVGAVVARRRPGLLLASARGASAAQLRGTMLVEGALIAVPAAAVGVVAAHLLLPAGPAFDGLTGPLLMAAAVPLLFVAQPLAEGSSRARSPRGRPIGRVRLVVELAVLGLAVLAAVLLARRGLTAQSPGEVVAGVDPLLAAAPLLITLGVAVLVLRLLPLPLRALQRGMHRRRGAVGLVGAASAVRGGAVGALAVLALLTGVVATVFGIVMAGTLAAGVNTAARDAVGSDIQVTAPDIDTTLIDAIRAEPGVAAAVGLDDVGGVDLVAADGRLRVQVVFTDLDALPSVREGLAAPTGTGPAIYLSPEVAERISGDTASLGGLKVTVAGKLTTPLPGVETAWVVAERDDQAAVSGLQFAPGRVLVAVQPGADVGTVADRLRELATEAQRDGRSAVTVTDTPSQIAAAYARPTTFALVSGIAAGAVGALLLAALAIGVATASAAERRNRTLGVLAVLGMPVRSRRALLAWELAPLAIAAILAGLAVGLALPFVVAGSVDLQGYVGGVTPVTPQIPAALVGGAMLLIALIVLATGALAAAVARRADPSSTLRIGVE